MKLRYLYLAIGVLCNASLVSCGDSFITGIYNRLLLNIL